MKIAEVKFYNKDYYDRDEHNFDYYMKNMEKHNSLSKKAYNYYLPFNARVGDFVIVQNGIYDDSNLIQLGIIMNIKEVNNSKNVQKSILSFFSEIETIKNYSEELKNEKEKDAKIKKIEDKLNSKLRQKSKIEQYKQLAAKDDESKELFDNLMKLKTN